MTLGTITLKDFCFGSVSGCVKSIAIHGREKSIHGVKVIWCLSCLKMKRDPLRNKEGMLESIKYKYQRCWMSIMDPFMLSKWLPFSAKCPNPFPIGYWKNEKPSQTIQEEGRWTNCCRKPTTSLSAHNSMGSFPSTFHTMIGYWRAHFDTSHHMYPYAFFKILSVILFPNLSPRQREDVHWLRHSRKRW